MSTPDPNTKIRYDLDGIYGQAIYVGRRTGAHLDYTRARLARRTGYTELSLFIIQGAWNTTVPESEGTHDKDAVLDVGIYGMDWWDTQRFLRECGWACWYRYPPSFSYHVHMISLGCTGEVGYLIPAQIDDYRHHRTGLAGHYADNTWHPDNIDATIFDFAAWEGELDMQFNDEIPGANGQTVGDALKAALTTQRQFAVFRENERERDAAIAAAIEAIPDGNFTKKAVRAVLDHWQRDQEKTP